jgi:hypothetical protein
MEIGNIVKLLNMGKIKSKIKYLIFMPKSVSTRQRKKLKDGKLKIILNFLITIDF